MVRNMPKKKNFGEGKMLHSPLEKAKGLMFCNRVKEPLVFIFGREQYISLHMLFVFCAIDVILIGNDKKVVELKENLKPFTFFNSRSKARYVIELAQGEIKRTKTKVGDTIEF